MQVRRLAPAAQVLAGLSLLLAACTAPAPAAPTATGGTTAGTAATAAPKPVPAASQREVTVGLSADVETVDPGLNFSTTTITVVNHMFDTLVQRDPRTMKPVPKLAESWDIPDPKTYIFHLRKDARFHDGSEVTASDVKFSIDRILDPNFKTVVKAYFIGTVQSVEVIDPYTVKFNLKVPYAPFLMRMPSLYVVPEKYLKSVGDQEFAKKPIGSGPYKFVEWVKDDHLRLAANDSYWGGAPAIKKLVFRPIPEESTRVSALLAGEVDVIEALSPDSVPAIQKDKNARIEAIPDNAIYFFVMNSRQKPFDDVRVRQAVNYAIDWDTIVKQLYGEYGGVSRIPLLPNDFGYPEISAAVKQYTYPYDPAKAKQLLADAGLPNGFDTVVETPANKYPKDVDFSQAVAASLGKAGIRAKVNTYEYNVFQSQHYSPGKIEGLGLYTMRNILFDPDQILENHFDENRTQSGKYFFDPKLTALASQGLNTVDPNERTKVYTQVQQFILQQAPYAFGWTIKDIYGVRSDVQWTPRTDHRIYMDEASLVAK